jgi:signal transduction histidine kinase
VFTVLSRGVATLFVGEQAAGQTNPWLLSVVYGLAVLAACAGVVIFWRGSQDEQAKKAERGRQLQAAEAELARRRFASDMLVNLARRNQSMLYRQLEIINRLEEKVRDRDALVDLLALDHLATRVRRNAESLLVLAGEQPPRTSSSPMPLRDVIRAAIAEIEDDDRVQFTVDERVPPVSGRAVADLTHLLAELTENAVRFSPPDTTVTIRARPNPGAADGCVVTVEDWGVGMPPADLAAANALLARPQGVDLALAQRLGFDVVSRLAARHGVSVTLGPTPGSGVTAAMTLPASLFAPARAEVTAGGRHKLAVEAGWRGWWNPESETAPPAAASQPDAPPPFVPSPRARPDEPPSEGPSAVRGGLSRRVPQAHIAPELRVPPPADTVPAPALDTAAASALSRYQASRQAAQQLMDETATPGGGA